MSKISSFLLLFFLAILAVPEAFGDARISILGKSKIDFGSYPAKEAKETRFIIKNNGDFNLKILGLRITCDCSTVSITQKNIGPGKSAKIILKVKANSMTGKFNRKVYIISNDSKNKITELFFSGNAIPLCDVKPGKELYLGSIAAGSSLKQLFTITPRQQGVILGKPVAKTEFPLTTAISNNGGNGYILRLEAIKVNTAKNRFIIKVIIPVQKPKGWGPIEIILTGRAVKAST
jgi:Protein of unknown function (DUF1573)